VEKIMENKERDKKKEIKVEKEINIEEKEGKLNVIKKIIEKGCEINKNIEGKGKVINVDV
jgi:hypothetical protein